MLIGACHNPQESASQNNTVASKDSSVVIVQSDSMFTNESSGSINGNTEVIKDTIKVDNPTGIYHGSEEQEKLDSIKNSKLNKKK
jgi:hypothetical protein